MLKKNVLRKSYGHCENLCNSDICTVKVTAETNRYQCICKRKQKLVICDSQKLCTVEECFLDQPFCSTEATPSSGDKSITWNNTIVGQYDVSICPNDAVGESLRQCTGYTNSSKVGKWLNPDMSFCSVKGQTFWLQMINMTRCHGNKSNSLTTFIQAVDDFTSPIKSSPVGANVVLPGDFFIVASTLEQLLQQFQNVTKLGEKLAIQYIKNVLNIVDSLVGQQTFHYLKYTRKKLVLQMLERTISSAQRLVQNVLLKNLTSDALDSINSLKFENLELQIQEWTTAKEIIFDGVNVYIPPKQAELFFKQDFEKRLTFIKYYHISDIMQMWTGPQIIQTSETAQLISPLLSMRLVDPNEFDDDNSSIKEPVEVTFTFPEKSNVTLSSDLTLRCGELNLYSDSYDKLWHYDACTLINLTVTSVVCQCQKMVDVGIINLIPQEKPEKPESQSENEVYVGFAFSILSCIFLLGVLQTKSEGLDVVIWNLGLTLLLFEICFLFFWMSRLDKTVESVLCYFLLIPVHFSFTATCFWFCCLSIQIFLILIAWKGLCIGVMQILSWVVPIVFVAAIVATFQTSYTEPERCLMTRNILVTFAFPPTAVVAGVMMVMYFISGLLVAQLEVEDKVTVVVHLLVGIVVFALFYGAVLCALLSLYIERVVFRYLFTLLNSMTGIILFLFYGVSGVELKDELLTPLSKQQTTTKRDSKHNEEQEQEEKRVVGSPVVSRPYDTKPVISEVRNSTVTGAFVENSGAAVKAFPSKNQVTFREGSDSSSDSNSDLTINNNDFQNDSEDSRPRKSGIEKKNRSKPSNSDHFHTRRSSSLQNIHEDRVSASREGLRVSGASRASFSSRVLSPEVKFVKTATQLTEAEIKEKGSAVDP
nr:adhesion G-protein coupled receptor F1-like [Biomphalaria glabrata]